MPGEFVLGTREEAQSKPFICHVGKGEYDLASSIYDLRGVDLEELRKSIEEVQVERRMKNITQYKLYPYADAHDLSEWDRDVMLRTYPPLYLGTEAVCSDCSEGPCHLDEEKGRCGLEFESYQAKLSLRRVCRGCFGQMVASREMLDYAIKRFGKEARVSLGTELDITEGTWMGMLCGFFPERLEQLDRALSYAEKELNKAMVVGLQGSGSTTDFEQMSFHASHMLLIAQEVAEYVKINFFGFTNAGNLSLGDVAWYPPGFWSGLGYLTRKPVVAFIGDNFLPAWVAVDELKKRGLTEEVQICGIGAVGDDVARFYDKVIVIGTMYRAKKMLRLGLADVIVANDSCIPLDYLGEAKRTESRLIWTGCGEVSGVKDRTEDPVEQIVQDLTEGVEGVWIRDVEKAGEVAVRVAYAGIKRKGKFALSEAEAKKEAARCREDCDLCFIACPHSLLVSKAMRAARQEGLKSLFEVEKACSLCGKCERVCPENIPIEDIMVAAYAARERESKFVFRPGRGPATRSEVASYGYTTLPGNGPGFFMLTGCSDCNPEDIAWMAERIAESNGIGAIAGCAAADVARLFDASSNQFFYQKYAFWLSPRSMGNLGGCTACQYIPWIVYKYSRTGTGIGYSANFIETMDEMFNILSVGAIIWGGQAERMYALATAYARAGLATVVGPISSESKQWKRLLMANKWDYNRFWAYDANTHKKRLVEPWPKALIMAAETKEEALTQISVGFGKATIPFLARMVSMEYYFGRHKEFFGEMPDDWVKYIRTFTDLPSTERFTLIEELQNKFGWVVYGLYVDKIPHPDGRLLNQRDFLEEYGYPCRAYTSLPRFLIKPREKRKVRKE